MHQQHHNRHGRPKSKSVSRSKRASKPRRAYAHTSAFPGWRYLRTAGIALVLGIAIVAFAVALIIQSQAARTAETASATQKGNPHPQWIPLSAETPQAVLAAAERSQLYQQVLHAPQTLLGQALQAGTLGTPVLVHAYPSATAQHPNVWVIPVLANSTNNASTISGQYAVALLDFADDAHARRIRPLSFAGPFVPTDLEYHQSFPRMNAEQAVAMAAQALHVQGAALAATAAPELIYFPAKLDQIAGPAPTLHWQGGGQFADLAVWQIHGVNGAAYIVGLDQHLYPTSALPLAPDS